MTATTLRYREHRPHPDLGADIECLWLVFDSRRRAARPPDRIVPDGCPEMIIHLGDPFRRRVGSRWRRQPRAFLAGPLSRPWLLRAGPRVRTLGIRFRPGAVTARFPLVMARAIDREVGLDELMGRRDARELVRVVRAADRRGDAVRAAERWLRARPATTGARTDGLARRAVAAILRGRGRERIDALARRLEVHPRRLERAFARDVGLRPKLFARIVRLQAALVGLEGDDAAHAVDLALDAGYFDQAHLARDFRVVAGRAAGRPREADGELARHFTRPERLLAHLAGE